MGNQLAATAAVDLANVSDELELVATLGAEGRNYFATFHCLDYTSVAVGAGHEDHARGSGLEHCSTHLRRSNSPRCSYGFVSAEVGGGSSGNGVAQHRLEHLPSRLFSAPSSALRSGGSGGGSFSTAVASSPKATSGNPRAAGRGRGTGATGKAIDSFYAFCSAAATAAETANTTQLLARERAVWHQARWRQRLPAGDRPWRIVPSSLQPEVELEQGATTGAAMEGWCRDTGTRTMLSGGGRGYGFCVSTADSSSLNHTGLVASPPLRPTTSLTVSRSSYATMASAKAGQAPSLDAVVAGVSGEWRSNYGHYMQLLLRSGAVAGITPSSAVVAHGGLCMTAPRAPTSGCQVSSLKSSQQCYLVEDVVTKVFVRTPDDPGQSYFLKYVHQMMDNTSEQLHAVCSTLKRTTPRNCLWYSAVCERDDFCVLQRPYVAFSLRERLVACPLWTPQEKLFIVYQLLEAVAHLHETYGLVHGDIKPNNVLIQSTGVLVLCDMAPFKPCQMPLDSPLLFDYYYDTDENRACYVAPEKFTDQPLPAPPLESKARGSATYNVSNVNFDGHKASMDVFSTACVVLFLYKEEDPLTLSQVLNLRHLTSAEAREAAMGPILRDACVPTALHSLLLPMLCAAAGERPSAREVVNRGLQQRIFPASFAYLYESVLPHFLTTAPDMRLVLFHNQLELALQRCEALDAVTPELGGSGSSAASAAAAEADAVASNGAMCDHAAGFSGVVSPSRELAVCLLLPTLLQTLHSGHSSDEAAYRGLLCLRRCASYCSFTCLVDAVLPHVLFYVNNDTHIYGPPTRLLAIRLLSFISEAIARHLTLKSPPRLSGSVAPSRDVAAENPAKAGEAFTVPEEQWALMEHLVLPCLYDILRQAEQESTAVLVEVASRLPRLLLLARYITERRQLVYGVDAVTATSTTFASQSGKQGRCPPPPEEAARGPRHRDLPLEQRRRQLSQLSAPSQGCEEDSRVKATASSPTPISLPPPPHFRSSSDALCASPTEAGSLSEQSVSGGTWERPATAERSTDVGRSVDKMVDGDVYGARAAGMQQYLTQLRCLLTNGWNMLQMLYNHPCVAVVVAVIQQSAGPVAAFLGEQRVTEDLIPLLTTALTAPLRVQRLLYPQAILLHALLQRPHAKTLRLFVEEGLRHEDVVCLSRTLESLAVVVRSRRLPLVETMSLVHQCLPLLVESRLWLREAACGVVEAAAQTYSASDIALHLEYAVRPLLMFPVPLAHLRRHAATAIRAELASPSISQSGAAGGIPFSYAHSVSWRDPVSVVGSAFLWDESVFKDDGSLYQTPDRSVGRGDGLYARSDSYRAFKSRGGNTGTFKDVLPAVVGVTRCDSVPAPALLHGLPSTETLSPSMPGPTTSSEASVAEAPAVVQQGSSNSNACVVSDEGGGLDGMALVYRPTPREAARVQLERRSAPLHFLVSSTPLSTPSAGVISHVPPPFRATSYGVSSVAALSEISRHPPTPPHSIDVSPYPATLPPPSSLSPCTLGGGDHRGLHGRSTLLSLPSSVALSVAATSPYSAASSSELHPAAASLSTLSVHTGAIYATAPSPLGNGIVISAGAHGEAFVWEVAASYTSASRARELSLVARVAAVGSGSAEHSYTACQWLGAPGQWQDATLSSSSAPAAGSTVAFSSTDGCVRVLDAERNVWVSSTAVASGVEGGLTGLALQDRASLLVTTAAGGLHVVDTRCRGGACANDESPTLSSTASVWYTRLNPLDGAPSCICPLYTDDRACAAAVGTYGGAVCLYDLRYQLCAQSVVLLGGEVGQSSTQTVAPSRRLSIATVCVDPLSVLCQGCRPCTSAPSPAVGPSLLVGTTEGTVYRLLLQHGTYWPAFQCRPGGGAAVRTMLTQPTYGRVFTGSEDAYIRSWSTDHPEASHTLTCAPYRSPAYTMVRTTAAKRALAASVVHGDPLAPPSSSDSKNLASITVRECSDTQGSDYVLPRHAPDAILSLSAVRTSSAASGPWSCGNSDGGGGSCYLLSGARDGTLTLWSNAHRLP
ncbi:hypothetical protein JKF63_03599 [Porcisia hertigi]|uniref:non-specific serine/threonine protein kinase n=1 Tax=Porcisia hertigi TaxID=2761500 RepID=A0A836IBH6_9TRYP|nr:hypothetical protein JKF63_03599 [Porcisia hertigi]